MAQLSRDPLAHALALIVHDVKNTSYELGKAACIAYRDYKSDNVYNPYKQGSVNNDLWCMGWNDQIAIDQPEDFL